MPPQPRAFPDPPAELTAETAKETALQYEAAYVEHELADSAADDFSAWSGGFADARVVNETDSGYVVQVEMPYYFEEGSGQGETYTRARYVVSTDTIRRINGSGVAAPAIGRSDRS